MVALLANELLLCFIAFTNLLQSLAVTFCFAKENKTVVGVTFLKPFTLPPLIALSVKIKNSFSSNMPALNLHKLIHFFTNPFFAICNLSARSTCCFINAEVTGSLKSLLTGIFSNNFTICQPYCVAKGLLISPIFCRANIFSSKSVVKLPTVISGSTPKLLIDALSVLYSLTNFSNA